MSEAPALVSIPWRDAHALARVLAGLPLLDRTIQARDRWREQGGDGGDELQALRARLDTLARRHTMLYEDSGPMRPAPDPERWIASRWAKPSPNTLWWAIVAAESIAAVIDLAMATGISPTPSQGLEAMVAACRSRQVYWRKQCTEEQRQWLDAYEATRPPGRLPGIRTTTGRLMVPQLRRSERAGRGNEGVWTGGFTTQTGSNPP
jgi:hypothetical protein